MPQWSYLMRVGDRVALQHAPCSPGATEVGDYCGEWGGWVDTAAGVVGIRIMFASDSALPQVLLEAQNVQRSEGDVLIELSNPGIPKVDGMPFLPVYRMTIAEGSTVLALSGYGEA